MRQYMVSAKGAYQIKNTNSLKVKEWKYINHKRAAGYNNIQKILDFKTKVVTTDKRKILMIILINFLPAVPVHF